MSEQTRHPKIEERINAVLTGDMRENALEFVDFLYANDFVLQERDEDGQGWNVIYGGGLTNCIYFDIAGIEFVINFCTRDFDSDDIDDSGLMEFAWTHTVVCPHGCGESEICEKSQKNVKIFNKRYENICISPLQIFNPNDKDLAFTKKLILILKQNRDVNL